MNAIRQRLSDVSSSLASKFNVVEAELHKLIEYSQGGSHISYTPHGLSHVTAVEANYDWLLSAEDVRQLGAMECFCLLIATIAHDALMIPRAPGDESRARLEHAEGVRDFLMRNEQSLHLSIHEADAISEIVRAHHLYNLNDLEHHTSIGSEHVGIRKLGACLSMADLCHADASRAPSIVFRFLSLDEESAWHWRRHMDIGGVTRNGDHLEMTAICFSDEGVEAVEAYAQAIRKELKVVAPYFRSELAPIHEVDVRIKRLSSPVEQELRFQTDLQAILNILVSGVYESDDVFVRELIQNALDATYIRAAAAQKRAQSYSPEIVVTEVRDRDRKLIAVRIDDNGVGMDAKDIQDILLMIGGSQANRASVKSLLEETTQKTLFATFGVGILSCLKVSSEIAISSHKGSSPSVRATIRGLAEVVRLEESTDQSQGTTVVVSLRSDKATDLEIEESVSHYCRLVANAEVYFRSVKQSAGILQSSREEVLSAARKSSARVVPKAPAGFGLTDVSGEAFSAWIWLDSKVSRLDGTSEGSVVLLNDGIFIAEDPSGSWLPSHWKALSGLINFPPGSVNLPVSRDRVVDNDLLQRRRREFEARSIRIARRLAEISGTRLRPDAVLLLAYLVRNLKGTELTRFCAELDTLTVETFETGRLLRLEELRQARGTEVFLAYPPGRFVSEYVILDGKQLYHKNDDIADLQAAVLSEDGQTVLRCIRGGTEDRLLEAEVLEKYFEFRGVRAIDLTEKKPAEGRLRSRPLPIQLRDFLGRDVKFVELPRLREKRAWKVGQQTWLNLANAEVARIYSLAQTQGDNEQFRAALGAYVDILAGRFPESLKKTVFLLQRLGRG